MAPRKTRPTAKGDCYEAAGRFMMDECLMDPSCTLVLVHGDTLWRDWEVVVLQDWDQYLGLGLNLLVVL